MQTAPGTSEPAQVVVANEYNYFVKVEPEDGHQCVSTQIVRATNTCNECSSKQRQIDRLVEKNKQLTEELKQRSHTAAQSEAIESSDNTATEEIAQPVESTDDDIFEVERLLKHKKIKGKLFFLVRWEGYGPEQDSWISRKDLLCPGILNEYLKINNLK